MNIIKRAKVVVSRWNATDVYLVTGLVVGFIIWLTMGVVLFTNTLEVLGV